MRRLFIALLVLAFVSVPAVSCSQPGNPQASSGY